MQENPFYERHYELDRAAGVSVMKTEDEVKRSDRVRDHPKETANYRRQAEPKEEDPVVVRSRYLTGQQVMATMVLKRVEAVESKIQVQSKTRFDPEEFRKTQRYQYYKDMEKMMKEPPPTHHPTPKDKYMAKEAAKEQQQRERQAISIKLSAKPAPVKFNAKNALNDPPTAKPESTALKPMVGRQPDRLPPQVALALDVQGIFPLRKGKPKVEEKPADYMSSVDMFITGDGAKKKKKKAQGKDNSKALSDLDIARAFGGQGDVANAQQPGSGAENVANPFVKASMADVAKNQPAGNPVAPSDQDDDGKLHRRWLRSKK